MSRRNDEGGVVTLAEKQPTQKLQKQFTILLNTEQNRTRNNLDWLRNFKQELEQQSDDFKLK